MSPENLLAKLGLTQYLQAFRSNAIDEEILPSLTAEDLKEIGVGPLGHRKKILDAIHESVPSPTARSTNVQTANAVQHRQLTIMFADLVDSTGLSHHLGAEDLRQLNLRYQEATKFAVEKFGGYIARYMGDGVLAYFGYPKSHEDDAERAIRAGLELIELMPPIEEEFARCGDISVQVRIGIETGPVVVGDLIGEGAAKEAAVTGETPNLAARLQGLAEPNTVVTGPRTQSLVGQAIEFHGLGEQSLKGFDEPVSAWMVSGLGLAEGRFERASESKLSHFVGRDTEIDAINSGFARTRDGEAVVINVIGDPGIGKSRLVFEFLNDSGKQANVLRGHCIGHGVNTPFFPFIDLIRREFDLGSGVIGAAARERLRSEWMEIGMDASRHIPYLFYLLGHHDNEEIDADLIGIRTHESLLELIRGMVQRDSSTIIFMNDLHWIDRRSEEVIDALIRTSGPHGYLLLCTYRPEYESPWSDHSTTRSLNLESLSDRDCRELFRLQLGGTLGDDIAIDTVLERSAGVPLFVEELARHLRLENRRKSSQHGVDRNSVTVIPDTLAGLLLQSVDALSAASQRTLRAASVVGREFNVTQISGLRPMDNNEQALEELVESGLIYKESSGNIDRYRFKHALVQDAIYGSLLSSDRQILHHEVGTIDETMYAGREREFAGELSRHFELGGNPDKAAQYAYLAGEKAYTLFALSDAYNWFNKVTMLVPPSDNEPVDPLYAKSIVNQIPIVCWESRFNEMVELAEDSVLKVEKLGETPGLAFATTWLGESYLNVSRFDDSDRALVRAAKIAKNVADEGAIGLALGETIWLHSITSDGEPVDYISTMCSRLDDIAERVGDNYLVTLAGYGRWADLTHRGQMAKARVEAEKLVAFGHRSAYPPALCWGSCMLSFAHISEGRYDLAEDSVKLAKQYAQCGYDRLLSNNSHGILLASSGNPAEAMKYLGKAQKNGDEVGSLFFAYAGDIYYGYALAALQETDRALAWLDDSLNFYTSVGHRRAAAFSALALGELGAPDADRYLARAISLAKETGMSGIIAQAYMLLANRGDSTKSADYLTAAEELAASLGWTRLRDSVETARKQLLH